jgi:DNA-binding SARP family transcriptional activator/ATP/maltotriose-dependent transcriptional regulator MalT
MRGGGAFEPIERRRVVARLARAPVALVEAPGGYGKSTAAAQLAGALDAATVRIVPPEGCHLEALLSAIASGCRRSGLAALADVIDAQEPETSADRLLARLAARRQTALVVVDEVHRLDADGAGWLARLGEGLPEGVRLLLAGRRLPRPLAELLGGHGVTAADVDLLRFDAAEVRSLVARARGRSPTGGEVQRLLAATDGWPAAVALAAAAPGDTDLAGSSAGVLAGLVDALLARIDEPDRELLRQLGGLPLLSAEVVGVLGGDGALDRILDAGLPLRHRSDGWIEVAEPVRDLLGARGLDPDRARAVAAVYARRGELADGLALLHRAGDHTGALELLAGQRRAALDAAGLPLLRVVLDAIPDRAIAEVPFALVQLLRASEHQGSVRDALLRRASVALPEGAAAARRAVDAERALDAARAGDLGAAERIATAVLTVAEGDETLTRGRAHLALAHAALLSDTAGATAGPDLEAAAALFRLAGERGWEAHALLAHGYGCAFTAGAVAAAAAKIDAALALRPVPNTERAQALTFLAEVLTYAGRLEEAEVAVREATEIGRRLGDERTIAYAAWSAAELACQRGERPAVETALATAEANPTGWFELLAGVDFLAHAAEMRLRLGDVDGALRDLVRAEQRAAGTGREDVPRGVRARYEAEHGTPQEALALLAGLEGSTLLYPRDEPLRLLLAAVARRRLGAVEDAGRLLRDARHLAARQGDPDRLARRERHLVQLASSGAPDPPPTSTVRVRALGAFGVERDGTDVTPPPGHGATLVKLLAVLGPISTEEVIEHLWPDIDPTSGRARLRTVLSRLRAACGPLVAREGERLRLLPEVEVDATRFLADARTALAGAAGERTGLARRALIRADGLLLPEDRYADWAAAPRERFRRLHLDLLDVVAAAALTEGALDDAVAALEEAVEIDPLDEERYVRLGRALLTQGRRRRARAAAEQALAIAEDLDVEPGPELRELLAEVDGT